LGGAKDFTLLAALAEARFRNGQPAAAVRLMELAVEVAEKDPAANEMIRESLERRLAGYRQHVGRKTRNAERSTTGRQPGSAG
jgi:hypothetical protein